MKKFLLLTAAAALALPAISHAQGTLKVGTVDMNRAFKVYNKTKDSEKKINEAKDAAKKEYDDRAENYKKALEDINKLNQQLDSPDFTTDVITALNKKPVTTTTEKPATSPATTTTTSTAAPATTPKKP